MVKIHKKIFCNIIKVIFLIQFFFNIKYLYAQPSAVNDLSCISGVETFPEGSIKLVWTYPGPANLPVNSKYYIQYSTFSTVSWSTNSAQILVDTGPVTTNDYQEYLVKYLTGFVKNTTYYFKLWVSSGTEQIFSSESNLSIGWITLFSPSKANIVDIIPADFEGGIKLSWSGVGDDGVNNPLDVGSKWVIDYSTDEQHNWDYNYAKLTISTYGITSATTVSYVITGLISGVTYYFRIWTKDDLLNVSEISDGATMWAQVDISPPKKVTSIFVEGGFRHVKLNWTIPIEDDTLFPYNTSFYQGSYEIRYSSSQIINENLWLSATSIFLLTDIILEPYSSTTTVITNLVNGTSYYFAIKVADEKNNWSTIVGSSSPFVLVKNSIPNFFPSQNINNHYSKDPKRDFVISKIISTTSVVIDWTEVGWTSGWNIIGSSDSFYGDFISSFTIRISTYVIGTNLGIATMTIFGLTETSYTIHNLLEDTTYWWNITVFDSESLYNTTFSSTIFKFIINSSNTFSPQFPQNPLLSPTTFWHTKIFSITFDWKDAFDKDPGDFVSEYRIFISTEENFSILLTTISVIGTPATSYFLLTQVSTPSSSILLPYDNQKIYWNVVAIDSGAPFGYQRLESLPTQSTFFYINQFDEPPLPFEVYPISGPYIVKYFDLNSNTTYYIAKSTPIYMSWNLTTDPDPEDAIIEYAIFIGTSLVRDPELGTFDGSWRYVVKDEIPFDINFSSTVIDSNPAAGTAPDTDLYLQENVTYYWRIRARDRAQTLYWIWSDTVTYSPLRSVPPMSFIIDFTSDAPKNYASVSPGNIYNPYNLSEEINFSWEPVLDPDPFDSTKYVYLLISTYVPQNAEGWFNASITTITALSGSTTFYKVKLSQELVPGGTYFWQVLSWGEREWGTTTSTSNPFTAVPYGFLTSTASFVVSNNVPNKFNLIYPGTSTTSGLYSSIKLFKPTFYWEIVTDNDNYESIISSYVVLISSYTDFSFRTEVWVSTNYYYFSTGLQSKTTYWWKVIAYDKFNNYQTPYSTFVFSITNFAPVEFLLISPSDDEIISTLNPVFKWQNNGDPDGDDIYYTIQYSSYSNFAVFLSSENFVWQSQPGTTVQISSPWIFEENKQFYWRVVAKDTPTLTIDVTTSNITTFWTNAIEENPASFNINITSGFLSTLQPTFSWSTTFDPDPKDYVVYYKLCISSVPSYVVGTSTYVIIFDSNTTSYELQFPLVENGIYRWWVEAYDTTGRFTKSSSSYVFTCNVIDEPLDNFNLISPGSTNIFSITSQPSNFVWELANRSEWWKTDVEYIVYYGSEVVKISTMVINSSVYRTSMESDLITQTTSVSFSVLQENTTYFWYVKASYGSSTKWSTTYYFFVDSENDAPEQFSLIYPTGTIHTNSRTPQFLWQEAKDIDDGISKYVLQYCNDDTFAVNKTTSITISNPVLTSYKLPQNFILSMNTTYYWRVIAYDTRYGSATSKNVGTFFVPMFYPITFTVVLPSKSVFTKRPQILWNAASHTEENSYITMYELNLSTSANFVSKDTVFVSTTQYVPQTNLLQNATYYLQIFAYDNFGIKSATVTYSFYINKLNIPQKVNKLNYNASIYGFYISWTKVDKYEDGSSAEDIVGYNIYRSKNVEDLTEPMQITKYLFVSSTMTTSIFEMTYGATYYYLLKVVTVTGVESEPSEIVSNYNQGSKVLNHPEINARIILPLKVAEQLTNNNCELFITSKPVTTAEESQLNMLNKYDLLILQNNKPINLELELPIELEFTVLPVFLSISKTQNLTKPLTPRLFWYNGIEYIYVNSGYNSTSGKLNTKTKNIGNFIIRAVSFSDKNEIINIYPKKIFTPTSSVDNKIHFVINNITASQPEGEIYDLDLRYVCKMKYENYELVWDGKYESGDIVPKGIYLYKIKIGETQFTGTIIVAK